MKTITILSFCAVLFSCNGSKQTGAQSDDSTALLASDMMAPTSAVQKVSLAAASDNNAVDPSGTWIAVGKENAAMVIDKSKQEVYYPDSSETCKYKMEGDSINIKYKDYTRRFLLKMRGEDTLVFTGDDRQVFYRKKK